MDDAAIPIPVAIKQMTDREFNEVGQLIQRILPADTGWILITIPPHEASSHAPGACPMQIASNFHGTEEMQDVLEDAAQMFEVGNHQRFCHRPIEGTH